MRLKYTLTLSTVAEPGRAATLTTWTLTKGETTALIEKGGCPGDPHGDHARAEGRASAKKHAASLGTRIVDADIRVVYAARPAAPAAPAAPATPTTPTTPTV